MAQRLLRGAAGAVALTLALAGTANAATFSPDTFADNTAADPRDFSDCIAPAGDGSCTLREAVEAANHTAGDDEVVLAAGTYALNPADFDQIDVARFSGEGDSGTLLIRGAGARQTTVDGNGSEESDTRVFSFDSGSTAELRDLAITGGFQTGSSNGGAIKVRTASGDRGDADVTFTRVWLHGNHSENDGGAISNRGKLTLVQSLVSDNSADGSGGGIENDDELTLVNTTISGNEARGESPSVLASGAERRRRQRRRHRQRRRRRRATLGRRRAGPERDRCPRGARVLGGQQHDRRQHGGRQRRRRLDGDRRGAELGGGARRRARRRRALARFHNSIVSDNTADGDDNCSGNQAAGSGVRRHPRATTSRTATRACSPQRAT